MGEREREINALRDHIASRRIELRCTCASGVGNEEGECVGRDAPTEGVIAAVVTVAFNRAEYLKRHIESALAARDKDPSHM